MEKSDLPSTTRELMDSIDANGELPLLKRYWLCELLQPNKDQEIDPWLVLESLSAHKVEDIWKQYFPSEQFPIELLTIADTLMQSAGDVSHMEKLLADCKTQLDDKFLLGRDYFRGVYAGFAMWAAARNVAYGIEVDEASYDIDLEPDEWHASFIASMAWAGGAVWEGEVADANKRREFWTWFINDALPAALSFSTQVTKDQNYGKPT